jgi:hypothetical protein
LAGKLGVLVTGGSDSHIDLPGPVKVPYDIVETLR